MMVNMRDGYRYYRNNYENTIKSIEYLQILGLFMQFIMDKVMNAYDVRLGVNLGIIAVRGKKIKPVIDKEGNVRDVAPSWAKTKQLWDSDPVAKENKQLVYCFNEHSNNMRYRLLWLNRTSSITNRIYYSFVPSRANKRMLYTNIKNNKEYTIIEDKIYNHVK